MARDGDGEPAGCAGAVTRDADRRHDRALGALLGGAIGDALGMPTQTLSPVAIARGHGRVEGFVAPVAGHPVSHGLAAGTVTDDTEQTLLLARVLLDSGPDFDQRRWVEALDAWERDVAARGGLDLLGPSTRRAIDAVRRGVPPAETGRTGDTNGAAMRIAPVGILCAPEPLPTLVARVESTCLATHRTGVAMSAAAAVAAAVSLGIDGARWHEAARFGVRAARLAEGRGHWVAGASCAARIELVLERVAGLAPAAALDWLAEVIGTSVASQESVPAAFGVLAIAGGDPWRAGLLAANLGGDTDTMGAIAAGIAGACAGTAALPARAIGGLRSIDLDAVRELARELVARRPAAPPARGSNVPRLVHFGGAVVDLVHRIPVLPAPGSESVASSRISCVGGAFHTMAAAAAHGLDVRYASRHGNGPCGAQVRDALLHAGIAASLPPTPGTDTGTCTVLVTADGERTFVTSPGAEATLSADDVDAVDLGPHDIVALSGYTASYPGCRAGVERLLGALGPAATLVFDPSPVAGSVPPELLHAVLARTDWLSANASEARALTGADDIEAALRTLLDERCPRAAGALVRDGASGCHLRSRGGVTHRVPAPAVEAVDTSGAGDVHVGTFVARLAAGADPVDAARHANAAAALAVTRTSGDPVPSPAEVHAVLVTCRPPPNA